MSEEERQFPLAYGLLVHKSPVQVLTLISAIYQVKIILKKLYFFQPQNAYCIAVDERANEKFKQAMNLLGDCFPNIFVMVFLILLYKVKCIPHIHSECVQSGMVPVWSCPWGFQLREVFEWIGPSLAILSGSRPCWHLTSYYLFTILFTVFERRWPSIEDQSGSGFSSS